MAIYGDDKHTDDESQATGSFHNNGTPIEKDYTCSITMDTEGTSPEVAAEQMVAALQEMLSEGESIIKVSVKDETGKQTIVEVVCDVDLFIRTRL